MKKQLLQAGIGILFLLPLFGYALEEASSSTPFTSTSSKEILSSTSTEEVATSSIHNFTLCSQEAIESRDTKIASSRMVYNTAMAAALNDRKNKEKAAVAIASEDDKKSAIKKSVDTYKTSAKHAQNVLVQARKGAWQSFENDIKKCREVQDEQIISEEKESALVESSMKKSEPSEAKTIKETIKAQFDAIRLLFN